MELKRFEKNATRACELLKALSNPHRLLVLCHLSRGEKCVGELEDIIGLSQSSLSQHLSLLRKDKLVQTRRESHSVFYSLAGDEAIAVIHALCGIYSSNDESQDDESQDKD